MSITRSFLFLTLAAFALASCALNRPDRRHASHGTGSPTSDASAGRQLFLKNCAHCHGASAHGDEGPDLHNLDWSDEEIATRIRNGKKGEMTAFAEKLSPHEISELIAYLRTLPALRCHAQAGL